MPNEVTISVVGKDAGAKQALDETAQQGKRAADSLGNIGKIIGGEFLAGLAQNAFGRLNQFLMQSVEAAKQSAAAEAQLGATLRSTGGAAGLNADEIKSMARELQGLTNFEDDAILASSNLLLTFTRISGDVFPRAQKSILDVSQALGQDLQASTTLVGKALNDPIRGLTALSRAGVQFTEQQKEQIRTMVEAGDVAGAQTIILQELETQFGGSAEAAVAADGGITQMTNSIGDMQEEIGAKLLPVMVRWTEAKLTVLSALLALPGPLQLVVAGVTALSLGVLILTPRILAARAALISLGVSAAVANRALGAIGLLLSVGAAAVALFATQQRDGSGATDEMTASLDEQTGAISANTRELVANRLEQAGALAAAQQLGIGLQDVIDIVLSDGDALAQLREHLIATGQASEDAAGDLLLHGSEAHEAWEILRNAVGETDAELSASQESWERTTNAVEGGTGAVRAHILSLEDLADELRAQTDPVFAFLDAVDQQREAIDAAREAEEEYGEGSQEHRAALRAAARAAIEVAAAAGELAGATDGRMTPALRRTLAAAGMTEAEIDALAREMRGAAGDADALADAINDIPARTDIVIHTSYLQSGTAPGRFNTAVAHGGIIGARGMASGGISGAQGGGPRGAMTLVGEQGPEIVDIPFGSKVIPAGQTRAMLEGGGGGGILEVRVVGSTDEFVDALLRMLAFRVRTEGGGSVQALLGRG